MLGALSSVLGLVTTKSVGYRGSTYSATVVPATVADLPALVLLPPIGVGIDRTFCNRFVDAWAEAAPGPALHAIDVIGVGDSEPKPQMKRPFGGWDQPPRTPTEWAEQTLEYVRDEVGAPCVVVGQSNLCAVALEAAGMGAGDGMVVGVVLVGPPAVEALSIDKPQAQIDKVASIYICIDKVAAMAVVSTAVVCVVILSIGTSRLRTSVQPHRCW